MDKVGIGLFRAPPACMAAHFQRCQLYTGLSLQPGDMLEGDFPQLEYDFVTLPVPESSVLCWLPDSLIIV